MIRSPEEKILWSDVVVPAIITSFSSWQLNADQEGAIKCFLANLISPSPCF